jgi:hypothetical protein
MLLMKALMRTRPRAVPCSRGRSFPEDKSPVNFPKLERTHGGGVDASYFEDRKAPTKNRLPTSRAKRSTLGPSSLKRSISCVRECLKASPAFANGPRLMQ